MSDPSLFDGDVATIRTPLEDRLEAAARALFKRDMRRGELHRDSYPRVWARVAPEYREQARVALEAAGDD